MFDHEIMSKKHVKEHELDQLYGVQKSLMTSGSKYLRRELFPMKRTFEECQSVGPTRSLLDQDFGSVYQHRQLELRPLTGNFCHDDGLDVEDVKLSLGIGTSTNKRSRTSEKLWKNKIMYPSSQDTVDQGESTVTGWNENACRIYSLDKSSQTSTDFLNKVVNLQQDHLKIDPSCKKKESLVNDGMCQELSSITQGSNGLHDVKPKVLLDFDLNEPLPDEYSFHSNEPLGSCPSSVGSCSEACSQITTPVTFKSQTEAPTINLESLTEPSSDLTEEEEEEIHISDNLNITAQKAALSLVSISQQQPSTSHQDSETQLGSNETQKNSNENTREPFKRTCSIDSYEALCLKLEPSNVDEDCATSKAYEIKEFDENKSGIKLKRGRRLKDFQRDILPTLSSLTRREILEDINLLEGVLRSREYQKYNKAKTCKGENWFTPVKSKRSRANYAGSNKKRSL